MEQSEAPAGVRLQKFLADAGIASRRASEALIQQGRVAVNGQIVATLGARVSASDEVMLDGRLVESNEPLLYVLVHKPRGYLSTVRDTHGRPCITDLVPTEHRLYPAGRLDSDSEGLALLTNDGELAQQLMHPSHAIAKEYLVQISGSVEQKVLAALAEGIWLEEGLTMPALVTRAPIQGEDTWLRITIREGRNRQIRRMCDAAGLRVKRLIRTAIGPLRLGELPSGKFRFLRGPELAKLRRDIEASQTGAVIAMDGPAASGKTALARRLAKRLGWLWLDTGALYRALTVYAHRHNIDPYDPSAVSGLAHQARITIGSPASESPSGDATVQVNGEDVTADLATPAVDADVPAVAANPEVRKALLPKQREIANQGKIIVVGRDIGTVVLPRAPLKIYLEAPAEVRAQRRQAQMESVGLPTCYKDILADIRRRDRLDSERPNAPLMKANDAVTLYTGDMTIDAEVDAVVVLARERFSLSLLPDQ